MTTTTEAASVDGRAVRAQRTRAAIVTAHVDLLAAGRLRPTAAEIAERAGVSVRSLWLHFPDLEALIEATAAEVLARQDRSFRALDPTLDLPARVEAFCRQRVVLLEQVGPFARASVLREPFSPALRDYHRRHVERVRDEVDVLFDRELGSLPEPDRTSVVAAVVSATTWGAWATLRDDLGLSRSRSRTAMVAAVTALVTAARDRPSPARSA